MASKLVIIMVNTDPSNGEELGAPFFQASVAAAMDYEVEVICTDLIPECSGIVGGAKVIEAVMEEEDTKVLTY
jgi:predicted peroxiredoxin